MCNSFSELSDESQNSSLKMAIILSSIDIYRYMGQKCNFDSILSAINLKNLPYFLVLI